MVYNIKDKVRNDVAAMHDFDELENDFKSLGEYIDSVSEEAREKKYKPTKVGIQRIGKRVKEVVDMSIKRITAIKSNLPNSSPSSGSGYAASRVRSFEKKSSSPKKHLEKVFSQTATAELAKQNSKKETRPKRKNNFISALSPKRRKKVEELCSKMDPEVVDTIVPTGVEKMQFSPPTFLRKISSIPEKLKAQSRKIMIAAGVVPVVHPRSLQKVEQHVREGRLPPPQWNSRGRPAFIDLDDFREALLAKQRENVGVALDDTDIEAILLEHANKAMLEAGYKPLYDGVFSEKTNANYLRLAGVFDDGIVVNKTKTKNATRRKKENSIRSAAAFALSIASHLSPCEKDEEPKYDNAARGSCLLIELMKKHWKCEYLRPVKRGLLFGTDDKAVFVTADGETKKNSKKELPKVLFQIPEKVIDFSTHGYVSKYDPKPKFQAGQVMRMTFTMTADGTLAPLFAQALRLSEEELPKDKFENGLYLMPIKGMALSSGDARNDDNEGYILLCREGILEKDIHALYDEKVFKPLVKLKRLKLGCTVDDVPDSHRAIRWTDGGIPQLQAITCEAAMDYYKRYKIDQNKHGSGRTGLEATCDLDSLFRTISNDTRSGNYSDYIPTDSLIENTKKAFEEAKKAGVALKSDTKKYIRFFAERFPSMVAKGWNAQTCPKGFKHNGLIDCKMSLWPDVEKAFHTVKRVVPQEEWDLFLIHFFELMTEFEEKGMITEETFDRIGFAKDTNATGEEEALSTDADHMQRTLMLTHKFQLERRKDRAALSELQARQKEAANKANERSMVKEAIACIRIFATLKRDIVMRNNVTAEDANKLLEEFKMHCYYKPALFQSLNREDIEKESKLTKKLLQGYIFISDFENYPENGRHGLSAFNRKALVSKAWEHVTNGSAPKLSTFTDIAMEVYPDENNTAIDV